MTYSSMSVEDNPIETRASVTDMASPLPAIRPISDLRTSLNDVIEEAQTSGAPIFLTKNGKAALMVMDCESYERQRQHDRYVAKLREARIEERYRAEPVTEQDFNEHLDGLFNALERLRDSENA